MIERYQIEELKLLLQAIRIEFAADLDEDPLVLFPIKQYAETRECDGLCGCRNGIHLDLRPFWIEHRLVAHFFDVEVTFGRAVDIPKDIQDKVCSYSPGVGIRAFENGDIFDSI